MSNLIRDPKVNLTAVFWFVLWNLNSISVHNYVKFSSLRSDIAIHKFDIVCISETYFDSSTSSDDGNLEISVYNVLPLRVTSINVLILN